MSEIELSKSQNEFVSSFNTNMLIFKENLKTIFTNIIEECWKAAVNHEKFTYIKKESEKPSSEHEDSEDDDFESLSVIISQNLKRNKVKQSKRSKSSIHSSSDLHGQEYKKFRNSQHIGIQSSDKDLYISSVENLHKINSKEFEKLLLPRPKSKEGSDAISSFEIEGKRRGNSDMNISHVQMSETPKNTEKRRVSRLVQPQNKLHLAFEDKQIIYGKGKLKELSKVSKNSNRREMGKVYKKKSFTSRVEERINQMNQRLRTTSNRLINNRIRFERPSRPRVNIKQPQKFQLHKFVYKGSQYKGLTKHGQ